MPRKPITICVLGARAMPGASGGVEAHCEELLPRLAAGNPDLNFVLLARRPYCKVARTTYRGVAVIGTYAPRHRYFEAGIHTLLGVFRARFGQGARVAHLHAIGPGLMAPLAKLLGMRVIVTHHSRNYLHAKWNALARAVLRLGEWSAVTFSDRIIAVSPSMAAELRTRFPRRGKKVVYIPNGAPTLAAPSADEDAFLARLGLTRGVYVLAVGRLVPEKGFHDLIAAFNQIGAGKRLAIVGKADFEDAYSKSLRAAASEQIVFTGFQDRAALSILYRNAALFVLPSHHEGMPIAALEALAAGAPMLLSDIEANTDLALPPAHYFPVGDVAALAARLREDPARFAFDGRAMMRRYDWDEIARQTSGLIGDLLAPPARRVLAEQK